jgi:hypothetical protein
VQALHRDSQPNGERTEKCGIPCQSNRSAISRDPSCGQFRATVMPIARHAPISSADIARRRHPGCAGAVTAELMTWETSGTLEAEMR